MNGFFNIGTGELMIIIVIAILVIGPKRMLELGQAVGRLTRRGREIWSEVMKTIQAELQDTKEAVEEIDANACLVFISGNGRTPDSPRCRSGRG